MTIDISPNKEPDYKHRFAALQYELAQTIKTNPDHSLDSEVLMVPITTKERGEAKIQLLLESTGGWVVEVDSRRKLSRGGDILSLDRVLHLYAEVTDANYQNIILEHMPPLEEDDDDFSRDELLFLSWLLDADVETEEAKSAYIAANKNQLTESLLSDMEVALQIR